MARGARAAEGVSRAVAGRAVPWRQDLRFRLVEAHGRHRPLCRHAERPLRPRVPKARLRAALDRGARHHALPAATAEGRSAGAVLIGCRCEAGEPRGTAEGGVAPEPQPRRRERRLEAKDVEAIFRAFAEVLRELPPDTEAGWLDTQGDLRLAPDIGRKLRTARGVRDLLREIREEQNERDD